jgi:two-component system, NtrC family, sensor histidine kinase KinB
MTFRSKALLAQAPLGLALVALAIFAVRTTSSLGTSAAAILEENYRSVLAAQRMSHAVGALDRSMLVAFTGGRAIDAAEVDRLIAQVTRELAVELGNITEPGEAAAARELDQRWQDYLARLTDLRRAAPDAAADTYLRTVAPSFVTLRQAIDRILDLNQDAMLLKSDRAHAHAQRMGTVMVAVSLAALLLGGVLSALLTGRLVQPVARLREAADRIGAGDFSARVPVAGRDELAQLATTFNAMADRLDRYRSSSLGELLLAQQAAQSAIDSLPDPVLVFDAGGDVLIVNRAAEGVLDTELTGGTAAALGRVEPALRAVIEQARHHVLAGKGAYAPRGFEDAVRIAADGEGDCYYLARATPVYGDQGGITGATVILQDVTRLHRFDQLKNDLVATVAHEFRTPLTSLRMAIHMCLEQRVGPLTDKQSDLLYAGRDDCERLQRIVDELLDLAKIQGGGMHLYRRRIAPRTLIDDAVTAQRALASERQVELAAEVAPALPELEVDRDRIQLVFANLLTNAIRHAPQGTAVLLRGSAANGAVRFEVSDQGPGIPPEQRGVIFEKFAQGAASPGGAGLGLSIAREIITAHGGRIGVSSELGRGSTFWFTVPVTFS